MSERLVCNRDTRRVLPNLHQSELENKLRVSLEQTRSNKLKRLTNDPPHQETGPPTETDNSTHMTDPTRPDGTLGQIRTRQITFIHPIATHRGLLTSVPLNLVT